MKLKCHGNGLNDHESDNTINDIGWSTNYNFNLYNCCDFCECSTAYKYWTVQT